MGYPPVTTPVTALLGRRAQQSIRGQATPHGDMHARTRYHSGMSTASLRWWTA